MGMKCKKCGWPVGLYSPRMSGSTYLHNYYDDNGNRWHPSVCDLGILREDEVE